ncbi:MAG TPA: hypothetical protein VF207_00605 [Chthoniobacterales bacterium]
MTDESVEASADVHVSWVDWGLKLQRMTHASVGTDPWTVVQKQATSRRSRDRIYSFGFVVHKARY